MLAQQLLDATRKKIADLIVAIDGTPEKKGLRVKHYAAIHNARKEQQPFYVSGDFWHELHYAEQRLRSAYELERTLVDAMEIK